MVIIAIFYISCSNNDSSICLEEKTSSIIVEPMAITRSCTSDIGLYRVKYKDIVLDNVKLSQADINRLRAAQSIDVLSVDAYGYSGFENWNSGRSQPYRRSFSSNDTVARLCGIASGMYFVRDVYLQQTYTFPTPMVIVLDNNSEYPSNTTNIGWNPDSLSIRGFKASLSGSTVKMQTAAYKLEHTTAGQQVYKTYPVNCSNVVCKLKYIQLN